MSRLMTRDVRNDGRVNTDALFVRASMQYLVSSLVHGHLLVVGLGDGTWCEALSTFARNGDTLYALDCDEERLNRFRMVFPDFEFIHETAFAHRPSQRYNTIVAANVIEHVSDPVGLLSRFRRWLRPGGRVLLAVPNANSVHYHVERANGAALAADEERNRGHHARAYTFDRLEAEVIQSGLLVDRYSGVGLHPVAPEMMQALPASYLKTCANVRTMGEHSYELCAVLRS